MSDNGADEWPPPGHRLRVVARRGGPVPERLVGEQPSGKWEAFGRAVLGFHRRAAATAMCFCGRTVIECDVLAQARQYGLISE